MSVALKADIEIFSFLLIKSWIRAMDYAFLNYSELFTVNASYVFEKSWIENLNLAPPPCDYTGLEALNVSQYYTECLLQNSQVRYLNEQSKIL